MSELLVLPHFVESHFSTPSSSTSPSETAAVDYSSSISDLLDQLLSQCRSQTSEVNSLYSWCSPHLPKRETYRVLPSSQLPIDESWWQPEIKISDVDERFVNISCNLGDIDTPALTVELTQNILRIAGTCKAGSPSSEASTSSSSSGNILSSFPFSFEIAVPAGTVSKSISAKYNEGHLNIQLPKIPMSSM